MSKQTFVMLVVLDDDEARPWWEALCLPPPERWGLSDGAVFAPGVHVTTRLEVEDAAYLS